MTTRRGLAVLGLALGLFFMPGVAPSPAQAQSTLDKVQRAGALRVGWAVFHPYIFRDPATNEVTGFSIDLVKEMAQAFGEKTKVELVEDSWSTIAAGLQADKFDIFPGLAISLQRGLAIGFSEPYTKQIYSLLSLKEVIDKTESWKDFDKPGKKIGVVLGSSTDAYVTRAVKQAELVRVKAVPDGLLSLVAGRVDAYASAVDSLDAFKKEYPNLAVAKGGFATSTFAFGMKRGDLEWISWVDLFVREMKRSGRITELLDKYKMDHSFAAD